ncbi:MAG: hypothetical protein ACLS7X_16980 [Mediterraneibacter gnavus]
METLMRIGETACNLEPVLHHGEYGKHTVRDQSTSDEFENAEPLYLMALIIA